MRGLFCCPHLLALPDRQTGGQTGGQAWGGVGEMWRKVVEKGGKWSKVGD